MSLIVQVFGRRQSRINRQTLAAGVRKAPRHEIAVGGERVVRRALWGFCRGAGLEEVGQGLLLRSVCYKLETSAWGERAVGAFPNGICDADTGQSGGRTQVWSRPAGSQRGWQGL